MISQKINSPPPFLKIYFSQKVESLFYNKLDSAYGHFRVFNKKKENPIIYSSFFLIPPLFHSLFLFLLPHFFPKSKKIPTIVLFFNILLGELLSRNRSDNNSLWDPSRILLYIPLCSTNGARI